MKTSKISWHSVLTLKKHSLFWTPSIWVQCIQTYAVSKDTSISQPWKLSLDYSFLITVEKLHIQPFKQLLVFQAVSLISSVRKTFLALFPAVLTRTLTSEWPETCVENWKLPNQQAFTISFSLLFKVLMLKCQALFLNQAFSWQIRWSK